MKFQAAATPGVAALKEAYFSVDSPVSFTSIAKLYKEAKKSCPSLTLDQTRLWLSAQDAYTLHRQAVRKHPYAVTLVHGIRHQYQVDLVEVGQISRSNRGVRYLLTCIDVFSKVAWVIPVKSKTSAAVAEAFTQVLKDGLPKRIQSDKGREFLGAPFQKLLAKNGIKHFCSSNPDIKCSVVERFNRTLRQRLSKFMTHNNTDSYLKALPKIVSGYNHTYHRSIRRRPVDVATDNEADVWITLYGKRLQPETKGKMRTDGFVFNIGDTVRLVRPKGTFGRGYTEQWTRELFVIVARKLKTGAVPVYVVNDLTDQPIHGFWYECELQRVQMSKDINV